MSDAAAVMAKALLSTADIFRRNGVFSLIGLCNSEFNGQCVCKQKESLEGQWKRRAKVKEKRRMFNGQKKKPALAFCSVLPVYHWRFCATAKVEELHMPCFRCHKEDNTHYRELLRGCPFTLHTTMKTFSILRSTNRNVFTLAEGRRLSALFPSVPSRSFRCFYRDCPRHPGSGVHALMVCAHCYAGWTMRSVVKVWIANVEKSSCQSTDKDSVCLC